MKQLYPLRKHLFCLSLLFCFKNSFSQNVGINSSGSAPAASAGLDVSFTDKGLLMPRVALTGTTDVTTIPSPANSLLVYNTVSAGDVTPGFYYYSTDTSSWIRLNTQFASSGSNISYTAGSVNIGTTTSDASALLNVSSSSKGMLIPQVALTNSTTAAPVTSPTTSLLVYNTATTGDVSTGFYYWTGTAWTRLANGNISVSGWGTTGNPGTTSANYVGTTDAKPLYFRTNTATSGTTNRMQIESDGNVGIGLNSTTTASYKLQVGATSNPLFLSGLQVGATATDTLLSSASGVVRKLGPLPSVLPTYSWALGGNSVAAEQKIGTTSNFALPFITNNTEQMRINSTGQLGIGTSTFTTGDDAEKVIIDAGTTYNTGINALGNVDDFFQVIVQNQNDGNNASSDFVVASDQGTQYVDFGINSSGYVESKSNILNQPYTAYLYASCPQWFYIGHGVSGKGLVFFTNSGSTNSNNSADGFPRMQITSAGNVGIGNFVGSGVNANNYIVAEKLMVDGNITPKSDNDNNSSLGTPSYRWKTVYATSGTVNTSDRRLKTDIQPLKYGLKQVLSLDPVSFKWKSEPNGETKLGLIAQDLKKVLPEVVNGDENKGNLGVYYSDLIPVLINAIKEQQNVIDKQQKQISEQQKQFDELKKLVESLAKK